MNESKAFTGIRKAIDTNLLDKEKECIIFVKATTGLFTEIVKDAGTAAIDHVSPKKSIEKAVDFDESDTLTAEWIKKKVTKFADDAKFTTGEL